MAKDNPGDIVLKIAALVGGAWLAAELIKTFVKPETYYSCPKCNYDIKYGTEECPNCHSLLEWPTLNNVANTQQ